MRPEERKIPKNVGGTDTLLDDAPLVGTVEFYDGFFAFGPGIITLIVSQNLLPPTYGTFSLILSGFVTLLGVSLLFVKPTYLSLSEWIKLLFDFRQRNKEYEKNIVTDGGVQITDIDLTPENDTRTLLNLKKIHPQHNAVEREDGVMVGAVKFTGANLDTSEPEEWDGMIAALANYYNNELRRPIQLYLPMRRFDPTEKVQMYDEVGQSDTYSDNPLFKRYIEDRKAWLATIGMSSFVREYYAIVSVSRLDIFEKSLEKEGGVDSLSKLPGGELLEGLSSSVKGLGGMMSKREIKARQLRELERQLTDLSNGMAIGETNHGHVVDGDTLGVLLKEFWEGETISSDEREGFARNRPFVIGDYDTKQKDENTETAY